MQKLKGKRLTGERSPPPPLAGPLLSPTIPSSLDSAYNPLFKEGLFIEKTENIPNSSSARGRADSGASDKGIGTSGLLGRVKSLKISSGKKIRKGEE